MRRLILVLPTALLLMAPTGVRAAAGDLVACDAPPEGTTVIKPNETKNLEPPAPQYDLEDYTYTDVTFQLDLYPARATDSTKVSSTLDWTVDFNDWDLFATDADGNELARSEVAQFGPLEGNAPHEELEATIKHCTLFTVSVMNFQAVALDDVDPLQLQVKAGSAPQL